VLGYEININGQRICLAGMGDNGVLSTNVLGMDSPGRERQFRLTVSGRDDNTDMRLAWPVKDLQLGDVVSIRLIEIDEPEPNPFRYKLVPWQEQHDE
jgi:hypothetical protein